MAIVWPPALAMLGWRLGRHRRTASSGALAFWWAGVVAMAAAFQPRLGAQTALHAMAVLEMPETTVAAIWLLMAAAFRPRRVSAPAAGH